MTALLSLVLGNKLISGLVVTLFGALFAFFKGRSMGAQSERTKQLARDAAAMSEAQRIDQAVAGNDPDANRKELSKWAK